VPGAPPTRLFRWVGWGALVGAIVGAIGGLTGVIRMEYRGAQPYEHAIMLGWTGLFYGAAAGLLAGLIRKVVRKVRTRKDS
jgi:hypothetical protein